MAQRKPTPIQSPFELVSTEAALVASDPLSGAMQRRSVPPRTQLLAQRQETAMEFRAARAKFAITKTLDVHDHAAGEATASYLYNQHLRRGFGDGELTEEQQHFYAAMEHMVLSDSVAITAENAARLRQMARDLELPSTTVTRWEAFIVDLQTRW